MWCVCSLESPATARPFHLLVPKHATSSYHLGPPSSVSLGWRRRPQCLRNDDVPSGQQFGELGHTLLSSLQSKQEAAPVRKSQERRKKGGEEEEEEEEAEAQMNGSDVLWALQRASVRKKKMNKIRQEQRRASSSAGTPRKEQVKNQEQESVLDYSNVRPLSINPNWPSKLDELEIRLRHLSQAI